MRKNESQSKFMVFIRQPERGNLYIKAYQDRWVAIPVSPGDCFRLCDKLLARLAESSKTSTETMLVLLRASAKLFMHDSLKILNENNGDA
jgi:hypothetical protein